MAVAAATGSHRAEGRGVMAEDGIFGFDGTPSVAILANRSSGLNGRGAARCFNPL